MAKQYAKDQDSGFRNRVERVAIVGASGRIGSHITKALAENSKHELTLITRPDSDSKLPDGLKAVKVDYAGDDITALTDALRGQDCLIVCMAVTAPPDTLSKFSRAAAQAQVPYIMPNWFGIGPENDAIAKEPIIGTRMNAVVAEIKQLGVSAYLLLGSQFWYEFSLGGGPSRYGFDFTKRSLVLFDGGDKPMDTTTWPQSGRAVASLLSLKRLPEDKDDESTTLAQFANGTAYVRSFRVTQRDMYESAKRVTKTADADWTITHESAQACFEDGKAKVKAGDFTTFTKMLYSRVWMDNNADLEGRVGKLHNDVLGLPVEDLDEATAEAVRMALAEEVPFGH
ncbi:hypothetical protein LLEC1_02654 [Akanthomyces lecanii]|uniref:NAD(P)-binding domain-containing protein n=1 Tax=Cordyceps confragosa TaxID=2714763 RepID=A0A179I534_CORDF|nr:hypothetical protein LLEC1_02654 [Akanthomyces lecanii]